MTEQSPEAESKIVHPPRALPRKYIEPILYLADRMSASDGQVLPKERKLVEELAKTAKYADFRHEKWYKTFNDETACQAINIEAARLGLLVVLSLLLKADTERKESEHQYFSRIRNLVGGDPITVPVEFDAHKQLALEYFTAGR